MYFSVHSLLSAEKPSQELDVKSIANTLSCSIAWLGVQFGTNSMSNWHKLLKAIFGPVMSAVTAKYCTSSHAITC